MAQLQITSVTIRGLPSLEHITHIHGPQFGTKTREEGVEDIRMGRNSFYTVSPFFFHHTPVEVVYPLNALLSLGGGQSRAYLRSTPNATTTDNLLSLPRLPLGRFGLLASALAAKGVSL